jgi:hypothetical protein
MLEEKDKARAFDEITARMLEGRDGTLLENLDALYYDLDKIITGACDHDFKYIQGTCRDSEKGRFRIDMQCRKCSVYSLGVDMLNHEWAHTKIQKEWEVVK